jgi:hypothetical protein
VLIQLAEQSLYSLATVIGLQLLKESTRQDGYYHHLLS